ncbi:MAG TPA: hypothetical protein ENI81_08280 [Phycisphaerales bacterium]|nr:hypothetical protein [Phycisphaerales bacterium]
MPQVEEKHEDFLAFSQEDQYYDFSFVHVPTLYVDASRAEWRILNYGDEATDKEIVRFAQQSGQVDFLDEPDEDIYGLDDGEPV